MVQQFLDEWHFRVLHSGLAYAWDRPEALIKAMDIFEAAGMRITLEEKEQLANLEEDWMIEGLVQRMPGAMKKTIEHFLLQLQLVLSTATRVRNALEEGSPDEIAKIMEDGDTGITQQVLKEIVTEAGREVGELQGIHYSWETSMAGRIARLIRCSEDADNAAIELAQVQKNIEGYRPWQNARTMKVVHTLIEQRKKMMQQAMFLGWDSVNSKSKSEQRLQEKLMGEVDAIETKLFNCKAFQLKTIRSVMGRRSEMEKEILVSDTLLAWKNYVYFEGLSREAVGKLKAARAKFANAKAAQKENAKNSMVCLTASVDEALMALCVGAWCNWLAEYKKNKQFEDSVKAAENKVKDYMQRKTDDARGLLERMTEATEQYLVHQAFGCWSEGVKVQTFSSLLQLMVLPEVTEQVRRHYMGKMDNKEQKFEAVQTMIKSFASQLEQGIGNSPRSRLDKLRGELQEQQKCREAILPDCTSNDKGKSPGSGRQSQEQVVIRHLRSMSKQLSMQLEASEERIEGLESTSEFHAKNLAEAEASAYKHRAALEERAQAAETWGKEMARRLQDAEDRHQQIQIEKEAQYRESHGHIAEARSVSSKLLQSLQRQVADILTLAGAAEVPHIDRNASPEVLVTRSFAAVSQAVATLLRENTELRASHGMQSRSHARRTKLPHGENCRSCASKSRNGICRSNAAMDKQIRMRSSS
ncbi:unnamed protein product [Cladocopium goreaui]|uniref:Dynein regulatory complex protein 10 n=1 Tax=Cladocopium goreaui TaxID=2562237 RepID=A0A9P1GQ41_9DINO|nr:unnamed protein product [Cladocopium goreaui]